ncbi:MAG: diguanylate cyclase [Zoogloeaceae bacterium]|jgi:diguanylate cyclase|nr:diguanylate cyclase [Zoogloeaceae bacterium]
MTSSGNPADIARETIRQLALRRLPPTPDHYRDIYAEVSGQPLAEGFPERLLRQLAAGIGNFASQTRLKRELDDALREQDWARFRDALTAHVALLAEIRDLPWGELLHNLFRHWETRSRLSPGKKREALEQALEGGAGNPGALFSRLDGLQKIWAQTGEATKETENGPPDAGEGIPSVIPPKSSKAGDLLVEFREITAFILESCLPAFLSEAPALAAESRQIAEIARTARGLDALQTLPERLKRLAFQLELASEDQSELRASLLRLLRLVIENISELVIDDERIHGQVEVVREILGPNLSQRSLDDAEQRLKEIIFKQSQLKMSLQEARDALKSMLAGFVDHLADFSGEASGYHGTLEVYAERIAAAGSINDLESVLAEVMRETRNIQAKALRSHEELQQAQEKVAETERRIHALEKELMETSDLVRHDQLTGALTRRGLGEVFAREVRRSERRGVPMCLALLDIDDFKRLNDALGHAAGDDALVHLTGVIRANLRPQDTVARFGGEEFVILFPEAELRQAAALMARIQRELTRRIFLHHNQKVLVTFSAGIALRHPGETEEALIQRADAAMYQAKRSGKNQVLLADPGPANGT